METLKTVPFFLKLYHKHSPMLIVFEKWTLILAIIGIYIIQ